ncbi:hypothetical protein PIB30_044930 [Stylosanthes scabra]|uniref:GRF-type domain-containing protein n=1 Tax=Stylosanthes scabra TaxID=79078 RepID=A0ABU6ZES5_9FABA|nr:hypothetical protein [Stylosanthes scabra]
MALQLNANGVRTIAKVSIGLVKLYCLFRQSSWERYPLTVVLLARFGILAEFRIVKSASSATKNEDKNVSGRCFCGQCIVLLRSGMITNPGRWFIRCPLWRTMDCKYFVWVDEIDGG